MIVPQAFEEHIQWNAVKDVCAKLHTAGFEALLAGGAVRDLIMGREPHDFDIATNATPDEVEALFEKTLLVGKAFGVIVLPFDGFHIEVATFREDLEYKDGRRPEGVKFSTAKADAQRRDFTVNALFYDPLKNEVIDYVDGRKDISGKVLRTVGEPHHRFDEDKLRILRAIRFAAQLDFVIEPKTLKAIKDRAHDVGVVSRERIRDEVQKLLGSRKRGVGLKLLLSTGVLKGAIEPLARAVEPVQSAWLAAFDQLESQDDALALLALFLWPLVLAGADGKTLEPSGLSDRIARAALVDLRLDNAVSDAVVNILRHLGAVLNPSRVRVGELAYVMTKPFAPSLLQTADALAKAHALKHETDYREKWNAALKAARPDGQTVLEPIVNGKELIAMGVKPGPQMGELIREIYLQQLEGLLTTRAQVQGYLKNRS